MGKNVKSTKITLDNSPVEEEKINVEDTIKDEVVLEEATESTEEEATETSEEENALNNEEIVQNNEEIVQNNEEIVQNVEEEIKVIGFDNNPINLEAKGDFRAPRGFVPMASKTKVGEYGCLNGRTYQVIGKDVAVWCDNGKQFSISKYAEEMR